MTSYKCKKCEKIFKQKNDYRRHANRKTPCKSDTIDESKNEPNQIQNEPNQIQCQYCKRIFTLKSSLNKHLKDRCKLKNRYDQEKEDLISKLLKKN